MSERIDSLCQELSLGAVLLQYANLADQAAPDEQPPKSLPRLQPP